MRWLPFIALLLAVPASALLVDQDQDGVFKICCMGDSNTAGPRWCEEAARILPELLVTRGAGSEVEPTTWTNVASNGQSCIGDFILGVDDGGAAQVALCTTADADLIIGAFGTNDAITAGPPSATAYKDCTVALEADAPPAAFFPALVPPVYAPALNHATTQTTIDGYNAALVTEFGAPGVIDWATGCTVCLYHVCLTTPCEGGSDGYHVSPTGDIFRAWQVVNFLLAQ